MASSSSSSSSSLRKYEVFLSFRGEDTRNGFTSHLAAALRLKQIEFFIDDEELKKGDEISPALSNAIETAKISIIIFSKDYASSKWCLNELVKILECKMKGQIVIPVFYHVDPSDVRKQKGSFEESFVVHEQNFKEMREKVEKWRAALTEAANLSGYDPTESRNEAELVEKIAADISEKLEDMSGLTDLDGFVGLKSRIEKIKTLLCLEMLDVRVIGIWGMGGIGKTTLANVVFDQISRKFQGKCFMANVREKTNETGVINVRDEVISLVLGETRKIGTPIISSEIQKKLQRKKVLIVLDDVHDDFTQLDRLARGLLESLAGSKTGSRIIITTRDKGILDKCGVNNVYEVKGLIHNQALELFCREAFRENNRSHDLLKLSWQVVRYANGNPLALKVLGGSFHQKSKQQWEDKLLNLKLISERDIYKVLKISYDELNEGEKQIFLDIACFFRGEEIDLVRRVSTDDPTSVDTLLDKSLITVRMNRVQMHDLLQEMGREIVHQESVKEPGKRSRLWCPKDIRRVLKQNMGTDKIEGIFLDLSITKDIYLSSGAFANMPNLRLLKVYMPKHKYVPNTSSKVHVEQGLECLPKELRYLHWHQYPLKTLPFHFKPKNLVELNLPFSNLEQLWEGKKKALKLKFIDLTDSQCLTRMWDASETPNLERTILSNCTKLACFPPSVQNYNHLSRLSFQRCQSLRSFPNKLHFVCPVTIDFYCCENLSEFPNISGNIKELFLCCTAIEEVPSSIQNFNHLSVLRLNCCRSLRSFPNNLHFVCPVIIEFFYCKNLKKFPEISGKVKRLDLSSTAIEEVPSSIKCLTYLEELDLQACRRLKRLSTSIYNLKSLQLLNLVDCLNLENFPEILEPPSSITKIPQDIDYPSSLESLYLSGNNFESLPANIKHLSRLSSLGLSNCNMLKSLPELPLSLELIEAWNCKQLQSLPEIPPSLEELDTSILEMLPNNYRCEFTSEFYFFGCLKLNETANNKILADSQLRIHHMAIASFRRSIEKEFCGGLGGSVIVFPGNEIPEWFNNQSSGSSITIELPQNSYRNLIGFALCAVINYYDEADPLFFKIRTPDETKYPLVTFHFRAGFSLNPDDVMLGFYPCRVVHTTLSFKFFVSGKFAKVKCCGVCPVYANPNETKPNTFTLKFDEEIRILDDKADTSGASAIVRTSYEGGFFEPNPKRIRRGGAPHFSSSFGASIHGSGNNYMCFGNFREHRTSMGVIGAMTPIEYLQRRHNAFNYILNTENKAPWRH